MAGWNEQLLIAGMRIDRLGFDPHIVQSHRPTHVGEAPGEFRLRLEGDNPTAGAPARQPENKTALVGADVADDIAGADGAPDDIELGGLVAKPCLQRPNPKPDAFVGQPGF